MGARLLNELQFTTKALKERRLYVSYACISTLLYFIFCVHSIEHKEPIEGLPVRPSVRSSLCTTAYVQCQHMNRVNLIFERILCLRLDYFGLSEYES